MQINRLFQMVYILIDKKKVKAADLAEELEVSVRTIYRDLEVLSGAGIPVYTVAGRGGGIAMMEQFVLDRTTITEDEQQQIMLALENLKAVDYVDADSTITKLGGLFQHQGSDWIEVDFSRWGNTRDDREKFEKLKEAIFKKQRISFRYRDTYHESTERVVEPGKLLFKSRSWYLHGYCLMREALRVFKINRISDLKILDQAVSDREGKFPSVEEMEENMETMQDYIEVKLRLDARLEGRVCEEFPDEQVQREEDGSFLVTTWLPSGVWLEDYIISFGTGAEVLEPPALRSTMAESLKQALEKYKRV